MGATVEVLIETGTHEGGWEFNASADAEGELGDDLEQTTLYTARVLWDEAYSGVQGCRRRLTFTAYAPDGTEIVRRTERRP